MMSKSQKSKQQQQRQQQRQRQRQEQREQQRIRIKKISFQRLMRYVMLYAVAGANRGNITFETERLNAGRIIRLWMEQTIEQVPHAIINGEPTVFGGLPGSSMLFVCKGEGQKGSALQDIDDSGFPRRSAVEWFRTKVQEHLAVTPETLSVTFGIDPIEILSAEMLGIEGLLDEVVNCFGTTPESVLEAMGTQRLAGRLFEMSRPEMEYCGKVITFGTECRHPI